MNHLNLDAFKKAVKKHKILTCIIQQEDDVCFSYFSNHKMQKQLQTINSVTKTVVGLLIGIALDEGLISDIDTPIHTYFESYQHLFDDAYKKEITIKHLLTMTDGLDWPEFGEWEYFAPMVFKSDIIAFILSRPCLNHPGEVMNYNSGASHLLGAIIQMVTHETMHSYAKRKLFEPLDISDSKWIEKQGISLASDGLRIKTEDMMKIGELILKDGNNLVPKEWIKTMIQPNKKTYQTLGYYGYHIWVDTFCNINYYYALGYGGQFIVVIPKHRLIISITSRLYKDSMLPMQLVKKHILKSLKIT
ncbi:serine hydrolase domain-containing protein [Peloplasma aerotolerans]|uniref:Serine hydrolase n=1 Tax=Peloplasma aerotolerans TaxID=3044389 RepID=A0AAW6UC90_9MOLU|nr:serine hydrolase [Mariniplasma sp. M4Ah]MDI6453731.1 serine hydrolase [Mariniplasma sp. M4Ah]